MYLTGAIAWYQTGSPQLDPVVVDWVNRTVAAGGTIAQSTQNVWDAYVKGCKADGYWDVLASGIIIPLASDGFAGFEIPLVAPIGGAITHQNFVETDYSISSGVDPGSPNSTKRLNTDIQAQTIFAAEDLQISCYKRSTRVPTISSIVFGALTGGRIAYFEAPSGSIGAISDMFNTSGGRLQLATKAPLGYSSARRSGTRRSILFNGVEVGFSTTSGGTFPGTSLVSFLGAGSNFCVNTMSYLYAGRALTDAQELQHNDRIHTAQVALGRGV